MSSKYSDIQEKITRFNDVARFTGLNINKNKKHEDKLKKKLCNQLKQQESKRGSSSPLPRNHSEQE